MLVVVGVADCRVTKEVSDMLIIYALGSCVAVSLYDPVARVGGLLHFMLPKAPADATQAGKSPYMFADSGIPMLFREAYQNGAEKGRLRVRVAGGAQIMNENSAFNIVKRNCLAMRKIFWGAGVLVHGQEIGGNTAMIVDDSAAMPAFIIRVIWLSGLEIGQCVQAANGQEALDLLRENWIDIVLTDINMPVMNGEEFVPRMEQDEMLRTIPVLVVSTDGSEHRVQRMMALGARGYVKKPFTPELLRANIEQLLGGTHD